MHWRRPNVPGEGWLPLRLFAESQRFLFWPDGTSWDLAFTLLFGGKADSLCSRRALPGVTRTGHSTPIVSSCPRDTAGPIGGFYCLCANGLGLAELGMLHVTGIASCGSVR